MSFQAGSIAVVGRPNVGKSTLVNELIGQKLSITSHRPQTTRHRINAIDTQKSYQMVFVDTPGIHIGNSKAINSYMNRAASSSFNDVDIIIWIVEVFKWTKEDARVLEHLSRANVPILLCINKIDKATTIEKILPFLESLNEKFQATEVFPLSAFERSDIKKLRKLILKYLPEQEAIYNEDYITDRSQKFIISEFIREKLMRNLSNELPYDITVEGFLETKVYLELWVKVRQGWSDDKRALASLGYD